MNDDRDPWYDVPEYVIAAMIVLAASMAVIAMADGDVVLIWPF
jgi:hypothetical protein